MSRTVKNQFTSFFRRPKGKRNAVLNDARRKSIPPDSRDDLPADQQTLVVFKMIKRLRTQGMDDESIARKIKLRFPQLQLTQIMKWAR